MAPGSLLQQISVSGGTELQDPRQRDARHHLRVRRVEAFPGRSPTSSGDLDGPQELEVLHDGQETQLSSSLLVSVPSPF